MYLYTSEYVRHSVPCIHNELSSWLLTTPCVQLWRNPHNSGFKVWLLCIFPVMVDDSVRSSLYMIFIARDILFDRNLSCHLEDYSGQTSHYQDECTSKSSVQKPTDKTDLSTWVLECRDHVVPLCWGGHFTGPVWVPTHPPRSTQGHFQSIQTDSEWSHLSYAETLPSWWEGTLPAWRCLHPQVERVTEVIDEEEIEVLRPSQSPDLHPVKHFLGQVRLSGAKYFPDMAFSYVYKC